jgi:hypothetical protein
MGRALFMAEAGHFLFAATARIQKNTQQLKCSITVE